jgi:hypothetical protein
MVVGQEWSGISRILGEECVYFRHGADCILRQILDVKLLSCRNVGMPQESFSPHLSIDGSRQRRETTAQRIEAVPFWKGLEVMVGFVVPCFFLWQFAQQSRAGTITRVVRLYKSIGFPTGEVKIYPSFRCDSARTSARISGTIWTAALSGVFGEVRCFLHMLERMRSVLFFGS